FQFMREDEGFAGKDGSARSGLSLRFVILGGEALNFAALKPWFDRHGFDRPQLVNGYGPTETTVFATFKFIRPEDLERPNLSNLGRWIPDLQLYIADVRQTLVPVGVEGELLISGPGLARGYLNRPELSAEKFIAHPFAAEILAMGGDDPGARAYR